MWSCLAAVVLAASPAPAQRPIKVAVLQIRALDAAQAKTSELLQEVVLGDLSQHPQLEAIGQSDIAAMLGLERQKQLLGCAEDAASCLAELAGALDADFLVTGVLANLGAQQRLDLKLLDARKNRVSGREFATAASDAELVTVARQMTARLVTRIPGVTPIPALAPRGVSIPWPAIALGVGAAVATGGGVYAGWTVADFEQQKPELTITEATAFEQRRNVGLVVAGVGVAVAMGGAIAWWLQPKGVRATMVPVPGGAMFAVGGAL